MLQAARGLKPNISRTYKKKKNPVVQIQKTLEDILSFYFFSIVSGEYSGLQKVQYYASV